MALSHRSLAPLGLLALLACKTAEPTDSDPPPAPVMIDHVWGSVTWNVLDGDTTTCSYTRGFEGFEDRSAPWICGGCDERWRLDATLTDGVDCYRSLAGSSTTYPVEWWGLREGNLFRANSGWATDHGAVTLTEESLSIDTIFDGNIDFHIVGELTIEQVEGEPLHGQVVPDSYACGWSKHDPPAYGGNWDKAQVGNSLPDAVLQDHCEEWVRLQDLGGRYLIIDFSAMDCGPCQDVAPKLDGMIEALRADGIDAESVTILAKGLTDTMGTPTTEDLEEWRSVMGVSGPVLADRGYAVSMMARSFDDGGGWPRYFIVTPELKVLWMGNDWLEDIEARVRADATK